MLDLLKNMKNYCRDIFKKHYKSGENGEKYPTWNQLRQVSNKYNVPTAFFFMETEQDFDDLLALVNFRKIDPDNYKNESPELIKEIRKSEYRREIYLDLLFELDEPIPKFEVIEEPKSRKKVVKYIREKLEVYLDEQKSWIRKNNSLDKEHYNFLNKWKELITEKMGILIFETDGVILEEMRGLCIFHEEIPIILLNGKDTTNGRIFSLFHELTHLYGVSTHVILRRLYDTHNISHNEYNSRIRSFKRIFNF